MGKLDWGTPVKRLSDELGVGISTICNGIEKK
jgi:hypothetical protein